jgi:hypothetical protein
MNSNDRNNMNTNDEKRVPLPATADEAPLQLEPDDVDERPAYGSSWGATTGHSQKDHATDEAAPDDERGAAASDETIMNSVGPAQDRSASASPHSGMGCDAGHMSDMLRWALDSMHEPALAAADWLARDIDPEQSTAAALLTNPQITLAQVKQAKSVFKTMRIVGEKSADRRVGARMYAGAIAAALVRHQQLITRQSDEALKRAFQSLLDDRKMPAPLRDLAGMALCALAEGKFRRGGKKNGAISRGHEQVGGPSSSASSMMSLPPPPDVLPMPRSMPRPQPRRKRA